MNIEFIDELKKSIEGIGAEILKTDVFFVGDGYNFNNAVIYFKKKGLPDFRMMGLQIIDFGDNKMLFELVDGLESSLEHSTEDLLDEIQEHMDAQEIWEDESELE